MEINKNTSFNRIKYYIYILECEKYILYTGVTTDYKRRFMEHSKVNGSLKGAKFTKSHVPKKIVALWYTYGRSNAQKLEFRIKKLNKSNKQLLINDNRLFVTFFGNYLIKSNYKRINKY